MAASTLHGLAFRRFLLTTDSRRVVRSLAQPIPLGGQLEERLSRRAEALTLPAPLASTPGIDGVAGRLDDIVRRVLKRTGAVLPHPVQAEEDALADLQRLVILTELEPRPMSSMNGWMASSRSSQAASSCEV